MHIQSRNSILPAIEQMLRSIIEKRPQLIGLVTKESILEYLRPAIEWQQQQNIFPQAITLSAIISSHIQRLYDETSAQEAAVQLENSWVIETGAHLHIPRRYNRAAKKEGAQINSLLFQGQVLWALANHALGRQFSISLNSGRVPLDNTNSGSYLDLPALKAPITLVRKNKYPESPQSLIPATTQEEITQKIALLEMYHKQKMLPLDQYILGKEVLKNFLRFQTSFSDQVATSHALMLNKVSPIKQITLDSEFVGRDFMISLLNDPTSLTYGIFSDSNRKKKLINYLRNIRTGWSQDGSPFYAVIQKDEVYELAEYDGELNPETIVKGLEEKILWLTGVMKFFILMVEGGMLPVGGWTQAGYCTEIKTQSVKLLQEFGYHERAEALTKMPTHIAAVAPCWGIDKVDGNFQLLDAIATILNPSSVDFTRLTQRTGKQTLLVALPTLYEFLTREQPPLNYNDLENTLRFAAVRNLFGSNSSL